MIRCPQCYVVSEKAESIADHMYAHHGWPYDSALAFLEAREKNCQCSDCQWADEEWANTVYPPRPA